MGRLESLKAWAGRLKTELCALYLAYGDPRVPTHARVLAECRAKARNTKEIKAGPRGTAAAVVVVAAWLLLATLAVYLVGRFVAS